MTQLRPIWVRREVNCWNWYDWEAWTRVCSDMSETSSHICASSGRVVSVISVSTVSLVSKSYRCKIWFKRITPISLTGKPRVSLKSVPIESFWRSNIRHPLYQSNLGNHDFLSSMFRLPRKYYMFWWYCLPAKQYQYQSIP